MYKALLSGLKPGLIENILIKIVTMISRIRQLATTHWARLGCKLIGGSYKNTGNGSLFYQTEY